MTGTRSPVSRHSRRSALRYMAAALAPAAIAGVAPDAILAQEATPTGALAVEGPSPEITYLVQYIHPEKSFFWVPGLANDDVRAGLYGLDVATYLAIRAEFTAVARRVAEELLAEESFADKVDRLPFERNAVVAVLGESDTDSLQSWFEILRQLLDLRRPEDGIELVNSGISALTTTQAFNPFMPVLAQQPTWILCALGANDVARMGPEPTKTLVSLDETTRNLAELRRLAGIATQARWVWLTRMPIDEARMETYAPFQMGPVPFIWRNPDLEAINEWLRDQPESVVDIYAGFGRPVPPEFQEPDGLHPTLAGHKALAREFVDRLAG
ncbi:MAG: Lysophospholipase and related esterase-like protein [Thermomicrobiales bacterium]|jgi:acyl-CoA thioesterase I|nr:Lysophospholipase and related esterase-like protein [Thermomicrobiales bacterium]